MTKEFFMEELLKALAQSDRALVVREGEFKFYEIERELPPSYEQLQIKIRELEQQLEDKDG
jgi:hypothetical protein